MGFDFLKRNRKNEASEAEPPTTASSTGAVGPDTTLRVYGMGPSQEMRYTLELLTGKGLQFESIDVSADPTLQSWVRQKTGSAEYPQVFRGREPIGDYGTVRRLDVEGNLDRVLAGLPPLELRDAEETITGSNAAAVRTRLRRGDVLSLTTPDGETFDAWAEVYANPPQIYYRGEPLPLDHMDRVVAEIAALLDHPATDAAWSTGK